MSKYWKHNLCHRFFSPWYKVSPSLHIHIWRLIVGKARIHHLPLNIMLMIGKSTFCLSNNLFEENNEFITALHRAKIGLVSHLWHTFCVLINTFNKYIAHIEHTLSVYLQSFPPDKMGSQRVLMIIEYYAFVIFSLVFRKQLF